MAGNRIDLYEVLQHRPDIMIVVGGSDLSLYCRKLIEDAKQEFARQQALIEAEKTETYVSAETVKTKFDISESTLYRLGRKHILEAVRIGGQRRYKVSDLIRLESHQK